MSLPSRDLTDSTSPSSEVMVPRTRTFCAWAERLASINVEIAKRASFFMREVSLYGEVNTLILRRIPC